MWEGVLNTKLEFDMGEEHLAHRLFGIAYDHHIIIRLGNRGIHAFSSCNGPEPKLIAAVGLACHLDPLVDIECTLGTLFVDFQVFCKFMLWIILPTCSLIRQAKNVAQVGVGELWLSQQPFV